jgi:hypothetical protein
MDLVLVMLIGLLVLFVKALKKEQSLKNMVVG